METFRTLIEIRSAAIEAIAVLLIAGTFLWAFVRFLVHTRQQASKRYERYKFSLGRSLSLGLEFLVAADVIRTVTLAPKFTNTGILAAVILTRFFELVSSGRDGRPWPWQPAPVAKPELTV